MKNNDYPVKELNCSEIAALLNVGEFNPIGLLKDKLSWKIKGNAKELLKKRRRPIVSIVGTRDAGPKESRRIFDLICNLHLNVKSPIILSGLAVGVETAAHRAAIEFGMPTFAVMPCGLDIIYPTVNKALAEEILENEGGLISTLPDGTAPMAVNFLERNKVIAMMSDLMIVPYSKKKGGAMIAAKIAYDSDIPVLALPGDIDDTRSQGCNMLIRQGTAEIISDLEELQYLKLK